MLVNRVGNQPEDFQRCRPEQGCVVRTGENHWHRSDTSLQSNYSIAYRILHKTVIGHFEDVSFQSCDSQPVKQVFGKHGVNRTSIYHRLNGDKFLMGWIAYFEFYAECSHWFNSSLNR